MSVPCATRSEPLELVAFDGKHFRLVSACAFAPGQPLQVEVKLATAVALDLKCIGSVRRDDGKFDVRARAATLSRAAREALLAALTSR